MKITKLHLKDFQQFKDLTLDFTHPETGKPLDRVCFIGRNGTGKTTILEQLNSVLKGLLVDEKLFIRSTNDDGKVVNDLDKKYAYQISADVLIKSSINKFTVIEGGIGIDLKRKIYHIGRALHSFPFSTLESSTDNRLKEFIDLMKFSKDLRLKSNNQISFVQAESNVFNQEQPASNVNAALNLFKDYPVFHLISSATVNELWKNLIYQIKKRESLREEFENTKHNLDKTKKQLIREFNSTNPKILDEIAVLWDAILGKGGLYFDAQNASNPIQLTDNLLAYIKVKSTNEIIPYNKLSTGIKNFIFQLGHLKAIHFNRKIDNNFLLVDEPSQGLFPDFVYNLVEMYENVVSLNTQIFMATHNPIVAAQFHPYERFILDFDETGYVTVKRGVSPIGDDPNDILQDDFLVENIMPKEGLIAWQRYKNLKREIHFLSQKQPKNGEREKLDSLIEEMSDLGSKYHF